MGSPVAEWGPDRNSTNNGAQRPILGHAESQDRNGEKADAGGNDVRHAWYRTHRDPAARGDDTVPARRLSGMAADTLVGRGGEVATLTAMLDRSIDGRGSVVGLVGPSGIGKTRLVSEVMRLAKSRGVKVFSTFCESHATDVPFRVVARLLRDVGQFTSLDDSDPEDVLLLNDVLGIADHEVTLPKIDGDARRRRLFALVNNAQLVRTQPAIIVAEDVQWIDEVSESVLADLLAVIPQTPSLVLITYRPEYHGALEHVAGAQTIELVPLSVAETSTLVAELLGPDPSTGEIGEIIAGRAAGNPFFAEEITRELAERGVLVGQRGSYTCRADVGEVRVPATPQESVAARIDRLDAAAKRTLAAAAVIGSRFSIDLLARLENDPCVEELIDAELVDQLRVTPSAAYGFRNPLIRTVAYEAQLKPDRAALHRRLAAGIEAARPGSADQNAALIAAHQEAAGDWARRVSVAYARRNVGHEPRHRRGATELGARPNDRRCPSRRRPEPHGPAHRSPHHVVRDGLPRPHGLGGRPL